ncbi:MAG: hypothetical protein AAF328_08365 [Planctomycetota bacterium]
MAKPRPETRKTSRRVDDASGLAGYGPAPFRIKLRERFVHDPNDVRRLERDARHAGTDTPVDWLFVADAEQASPYKLFDRLRWGGQAVIAAKSEAQATELYRLFLSRDEWRIDAEPVGIEFAPRSWWKPWAQTHGVAFVVRKVLLELPENPTLRHSYDVRLEPWPGVEGGYCVQKRIPMPEQISRRLLANLDPQDRPTGEALERVIHKLRRKVFPMFLTREAGFLKILRRDLPEDLRDHVPDVLDMEYGDKGYVACLRSRWLRLGGDPVDPLSFATQAAELVQKLHDAANVVHLDLRLDNFVITENGVKCVDFGSALRRGEDISTSPVLVKLFTEMLSASQIRRDLMRMIDKGAIRSSAFARAYSPPGPAADLFSLVSNFGRLEEHPDFRGLIQDHPRQDAMLTRLRREVFKPADPKLPGVMKVRDLVRVLQDGPGRARSVPLSGSSIGSGLAMDETAVGDAKPSLPFTLAVPVGGDDSGELETQAASA